MSDEKKQPEEQAAELWIIEKLREIRSEIEKGRSRKKIKNLFDELFAELSYKELSFFLEDEDEDSGNDENTTSDIKMTYIYELIYLSESLCKPKNFQLLIDFWTTWWQSRSTKFDEDDLYAVDSLALIFLSSLEPSWTNKLYKKVESSEWDFYTIKEL